MPRFHIQLTKSAIGDIDAIPDNSSIISDIKKLEVDPLPDGTTIKKLKGFKPPIYRLRTAGFRTLFRIEGTTITVMRVIDRKLLERIIKKMR